MSATTTATGTARAREYLHDARSSPFRWTHGLINRLVSVGDVAALLLATIAYSWLGHAGSAPLTLPQSLFLSAIEAAVLLFVLKAVAAYRVEYYTRLSVSLGSAAAALACAWLVGAACTAAFAPSASIAFFLTYHLPQLVLLMLGRVGAYVMVGQIDRLALMRRDAIVIGSGIEAEAMVRRLTAPEQAGKFNVIGVISDGTEVAPGLFAGQPLLGDLGALAYFGQRDAVDLVVIAIPLSNRARLPGVIEALQWVSADVVLSLDSTTAQSADRALHDIAGQAVLPLMQKPLKGSQALLKFLEDRVIAAIALVTISPLLLATAIAVRLDSPGPALFRQDRVGLHNRTFRIFKFRTMTVDATDDGSKGTNSRSNPRITRVGGVLRRLSIDELPQLLNVLLGDMSIVGPRPYVRNMLVEDETFDSAVRGFAARHRIKPGITGLAQASGFRSNALRNKSNAAMSVQLDMDYIANWSLWLDLKIMVRTITHGLRGPEVF
jgi:putative colanic acid biosynthesis UDP-glucose lipid carrier transferase